MKMKDKCYFVSIQTCYEIDGAGDLFKVISITKKDALKFSIKQVKEIPWDSPCFKEATLTIRRAKNLESASK